MRDKIELLHLIATMHKDIFAAFSESASVHQENVDGRLVFLDTHLPTIESLDGLPIAEARRRLRAVGLNTIEIEDLIQALVKTNYVKINQ